VNFSFLISDDLHSISIILTSGKNCQEKHSIFIDALSRETATPLVAQRTSNTTHTAHT
jgi:hypothetical protein